MMQQLINRVRCQSTVQDSEEELEIDQRSNQEQNCNGGATCDSSISSEVYYGGGESNTGSGDKPTKVSQNNNQKNSCSNGAKCSSSSTSKISIGAPPSDTAAAQGNTNVPDDSSTANPNNDLTTTGSSNRNSTSFCSRYRGGRRSRSRS